MFRLASDFVSLRTFPRQYRGEEKQQIAKKEDDTDGRNAAECSWFPVSIYLINIAFQLSRITVCRNADFYSNDEAVKTCWLVVCSKAIYYFKFFAEQPKHLSWLILSQK